MKVIAEFVLARETKNTFRFEETSQPQVIGVLYVQKSALLGVAPQAITVTVETA